MHGNNVLSSCMIIRPFLGSAAIIGKDLLLASIHGRAAHGSPQNQQKPEQRKTSLKILLKSEVAEFAGCRKTETSIDFSCKTSRIFLDVKGGLRKGELSKGREDQSVTVGKEQGDKVREQENSHRAGRPPKAWMEKLHFLMLLGVSRESVNEIR